MLDRCYGSDTTKELMKYTNLDSQDLFGTPPESLSAKMNNSMTDKPSPFVLKPKRNKPPSESYKKPAVKRSLPYKSNFQSKKAKTMSRSPNFSRASKNVFSMRSRSQGKSRKASFRRGGRR